MAAAPPSGAETPRGGGGRGTRRRAALALPFALLPAACTGLPTGVAAYLARDGEHAAGRLIADVALAARRVDRARELPLLRAALDARPGTAEVPARQSRPIHEPNQRFPLDSPPAT